jgi:hypothetical protein
MVVARQRLRQRQPQTSWTQIREMLPRGAHLQAAKAEFMEILNDAIFTVLLAPSRDYMMHCRGIIEMLPHDVGYRIGMCRAVGHRYYRSPFAYTQEQIQTFDKVRYEGMVVAFSHHSRDVVAMLEHTLIDVHIRSDRRCCNLRRELDDGERFVDHGSGDEDDRQHFLYIVFGPRIRR